MLWAVTSYFNPMRYARRLANYREFRKRLDVPLVAVELGFEGRFELTGNDADILVQLEGRDVLWQKERLLNLAIERLPAECRVVACVDCDVFFTEENWARQALAALDRDSVVQLFATVHHLRSDWDPESDPRSAVIFSQPAATREIAATGELSSGLGGPVASGSGAVILGLALAFRRELLERHGLFDACIAGGGDRALVSAAYGRLDDVARLHCMNPNQSRFFRAWAEPFFGSVLGRVCGLKGDLFHLWHGREEDRRYAQRHRDLQRFDFDPARDIALDESGCWRWNSDKPQLHAYLKEYFAARREDG
jgi:hypothetical protein